MVRGPRGAWVATTDADGEWPKQCRQSYQLAFPGRAADRHVMRASAKWRLRVSDARCPVGPATDVRRICTVVSSRGPAQGGQNLLTFAHADGSTLSKPKVSGSRPGSAVRRSQCPRPSPRASGAKDS